MVFESCDVFLYAVRPDGSLAWKVKTSGGLVNAEAGDVDGDGGLEVVAAGTLGVLYVVDASTGRVKWRKGDDTFIASPLVYDFDGDGAEEVVVGTLRRDLHVYRGARKYGVLRAY